MSVWASSLGNLGRRAGAKILNAFEKHPLAMNTFVGGGVYFAGEVVSQSLSLGPSNLDWDRCSGITALGKNQ
jgi:hypothetical protein